MLKQSVPGSVIIFKQIYTVILFRPDRFIFFQKHIRSKKAAFMLTIPAMFIITELFIPLLGMYDYSIAYLDNLFIFRWFIVLNILFLFYFWLRVFLPDNIQKLNDYRIIKWFKAALLTLLILTFY